MHLGIKLAQMLSNLHPHILAIRSESQIRPFVIALPAYNIKAFKKRKQKQDEDEVKRNDALVALQKALYFKRFESSLIAFKSSITSQRNFQTNFYRLLTEQGKLLDSKNFRKLILASEDEEESNSVNTLIELLEEIDSKDYDLNQLQQQIESDLTILNNIITKLKIIESSAAANTDYDCKLAAFKYLLKTQLPGQRLLVFSYFKDTASYLYQQLITDTAWLTQMQVNGKTPVIELLTGATPSKQREEKVKRFAPKANSQSDEELAALLQNPIDILICTDVLSEGQNLQDAGVLVNYDLHWNPVRMIQRAGRIDRLGTDYEQLFIYNCFPEQGLEDLLGLVRRLQHHIATIDREVGLDGSVLGETISDKSLEELYKLKMADTDAEKEAILAELEQASDLVSLDEMRLPLLEFLQQASKELIDEIPFGIHSTSNKLIAHHKIFLSQSSSLQLRLVNAVGGMVELSHQHENVTPENLVQVSPDLNRIEKCWATLKSRIRKQLHNSDNLRDAIEFVLKQAAS
jgi:hypothetical protein